MFKYISLNENYFIFILISQKFICWGPMYSKSWLIQVITWHFTSATHGIIWQCCVKSSYLLTHWGQVMHICISKLTIIGPDNVLSPGRRPAIIWTNAGKLLNGLLGTNFSEIEIEIQTFSLKKMHWKMSSVKWRPFCLGLNVLTHWSLVKHIHQWTGSLLVPV